MNRRWQRYTERNLLKLRLSDLALDLNAVLRKRVAKLNEELAAKGLRFRPHYWLGEEWFTPDGVPGIAIPFYLAHPRLIKLERKFMLEAEGASEFECMRILRHEAGHAIDNAYRLHRRKRWRELFGPSSIRYPDSYKPRPNSRKFVLHLNGWYAQAHPAEDFAETFAVWLTPGYPWRKRYAGWPALEKLEYVDELMQEIGSQPMIIKTRRKVEPLREIKMTLVEHYRKKRTLYAVDWPGYYDRDLRRVFSNEPRYKSRMSAAAFLRSHRIELCEKVAHASGMHPYAINFLVRNMVERSKAMKLRLCDTPTTTRETVMLILTVHAVHFAHSGYLPIAV